MTAQEKDPERRTSMLNIRIEPSLNEGLRRVARRERLPYSAVVRRACWDHVESKEGGSKSR